MDYPYPAEAATGPRPRPGQPGYQMSDEQKLKMAEGRRAARDRRLADKLAREAQGKDYFDITGGTPEERAQGAPSITDVVATTVQAASGGASNAAEIAAAVAAAVASVFRDHAPPQSPNGPKAVPPEIQKRRNAARDRMLVLLDDVKRGTRDEPIYDLTQDFYDNWKYIEANVRTKTPDGIMVERRARIVHKDEPNESMVPVNQIAREISACYLESIGGKTPDLGEAVYDAYRGRPRYEPGAQMIGPTGTPVFPDNQMADRAQLMAQERGAQVIMNPPEENMVYTGPPQVMPNLRANESRY